MIPEAPRIASGYECLLSDLRALPDDTTVVSLDDRALAATFYACNRLLHVPPTSVPIGGPPAADRLRRGRPSVGEMSEGRSDRSAYRRNRLVLFEANLFHRTSPGRFKSGYENRRVKITFFMRPDRGAIT
jgi:hypothetical protein